METCIKMVEDMASAMVKGSDIQHIPGISKNDRQNIVLGLRRLQHLGKMLNDFLIVHNYNRVIIFLIT